MAKEASKVTGNPFANIRPLCEVRRHSRYVGFRAIMVRTTVVNGVINNIGKVCTLMRAAVLNLRLHCLRLRRQQINA